MRIPILAALLALAPAFAQSVPDLAAPERLRAGDQPIDVGQYTGHAGPLVGDLDGDGRPDLLVGTFRGHIQVFRNVGDGKKPKLADQGLLQAGGKDIRIHNW